jgi:cytochrome P450
MRIALNVISAVGFGKRIDFDASASSPIKEKMSGQAEALQIILGNLPKVVLIPRYFLNLPISNFRRVGRAYDEVKKHLQELIDSQRKNGSSDGEHTILRSLVEQSSSDAKSKNKRILQDDEIMGNSFIYLLAGHETTYRSQ